MIADYVVVGSGLTGLTIARRLADAGRDVVVIERRTVIGGNVVDSVASNGVPIHDYGPHQLRTNNAKLWAWFSRFAPLWLWENRVLSWVDGEWRQWPPSQEYVDEVAPGWAPQPRGDAANFEEAALAAWPRPIYEKFMKGYTEKQWGVPATEVLASVAGRFVVAERGDTRFKPQTLQGLPGEGGFARMMQRMAEGIHVLLGVDWLKDRGAYQPRKALVFTGPVDAYFAWQAGRLEYRCQRRVHEHVDAGPGEFVQPAPVLNFPGRDVPWVRRIEWKRWMPGGASKWIRDSVLTTEMPDRAEHQDEFEYPVPTAANAQRAKAYRALAHGERQRDVPVYICGRLGDYRYYDMDQAVARAHMLATEILGVDDSGYWTDMTGSEL